MAGIHESFITHFIWGGPACYSKGGRLPASFHAPEQAPEKYNCLMSQELSGPGWKLPLDGNCTSGGLTSGPNGMAYVATDSPAILAVSAAGKVAWKVAAPCNANHLLITLPGQLLFTCQDRIFHALLEGKESWSASADGKIFSNMAADASGTLYYGDYGPSGATHLHALDGRGKEAWMLDTKRLSVSSIALDNRKRLFVVGSFLRSALLCLTD